MRQYLTFAGLERFIHNPSTQTIWDLLFSNSTRVGPFPVVKEFCQFFLLLLNKAEQGSKLPYQVPIHVRCKLDPRYRDIWQTVHRPGFLKTEVGLAEYVDRILNPWTRGMTLVTILEVMIEDFSPLKASRIVKAVIDRRGTLDCLTHVSEQQLANLLACYVRGVKKFYFADPSQSWTHTEFDELLYFSDQILNLCAPFYNVSISERPTLFGAVIAKLEGIEIPLCLWIFIHCLGSRHGDRTEFSVRALYDQMIIRYVFLSPAKDAPWLMPAICIMNFLVFANDWNRDGFSFDLFHEIMEQCCGKANWEYVWQLSNREKMFERFVNCMHARLIKALAFCANYDR